MQSSWWNINFEVALATDGKFKIVCNVQRIYITKYEADFLAHLYDTFLVNDVPLQRNFSMEVHSMRSSFSSIFMLPSAYALEIWNSKHLALLPQTLSKW